MAQIAVAVAGDGVVFLVALAVNIVVGLVCFRNLGCHLCCCYGCCCKLVLCCCLIVYGFVVVICLLFLWMFFPYA